MSSNAVFVPSNGVFVKAGVALGGAFFHGGKSAELTECHFTGNSAKFESFSEGRASGGAVHVESDSDLLLLRCAFRHNSAGGLHDHQDAKRTSSATNFYSKGRVILDGCSITDDLGQHAFSPWSDSE